MSTTLHDQVPSTEPATREARRETILRHIAELISFEGGLEAEINQQRTLVEGHPEVAAALDRFHGMVRERQDALRSYLEDHDGASEPLECRGVIPFAADMLGESWQSVTDLLRADYAAFSYVAISYAALAEIAFKLYDLPLRELAPRHLQGCVAAAQTINTLMVGMMATQLTAAGLECQCICPMCSIGICGCVSIGTQIATSTWHEDFLVGDATSGFVLQTPRTGSQLAAAGIQGGDRLLEVDGQPVHSVFDVQAAITRHPSGDAVHILVQHGPETPRVIDVAQR